MCVQLKSSPQAVTKCSSLTWSNSSKKWPIKKIESGSGRGDRNGSHSMFLIDIGLLCDIGNVDDSKHQHDQVFTE